MAEEILPARVVRKNARVEHVGGRDQDARWLGAQLLALGLGGVAVVDRNIELSTRNAENLTAKMQELNEEKKLTRGVPNLDNVTDWIEQAKGLPALVTH